MSRLTGELIRRILEEEHGVEVVGEVTDATHAVRELIEEAEANVIIVGTSTPDLITNCRALLEGHPLRRVIAVSADARAAHVYGIRPYEAVLDELSPQVVVDVVRDSDSPFERVAT
jgi:DNA-binding NarL/FixJ family response regulator